MIGIVWRFFLAVLDWRTVLRWFFKKPLVDVIFISNMRDEIDKKRFLGNKQPINGYFNSIRLFLKGTIARAVFINSLTEDTLRKNRIREARRQFTNAIDWANANGAKIILLAASTKRLFGETGDMLKKETKYRNIVFTIGDNGTMYLLKTETLSAFEKSGLKPSKSRIAVIGPYGILGEMMVRILNRKQFDLVGIGSNIGALEKVKRKYNIDICHIETQKDFDQLGEVDAIVACTHSEKVRLTAEVAEKIRRSGKKLLLIDVAEPSNLSEEEYQKCKSFVVRQDAGNAYSPKLEYGLGCISYKLGRLSRGVTFGCFAEAIALHNAIKRGIKIQETDWFEISENNMHFVADMFDKTGFTIPEARCFGKKVKSFNLNFEEREEKTECYEAHAFKEAFSRIRTLF